MEVVVEGGWRLLLKEGEGCWAVKSGFEIFVVGVKDEYEGVIVVRVIVVKILL